MKHVSRPHLIPTHPSVRLAFCAAACAAALAAALAGRAQVALDLPPSLRESSPDDPRAERLALPFPESGVVRLHLAMDVTNGVRPPEGPARIRVAHLQSVMVTAPTEWTHPIQWLKDGQPIPGATDRTYRIPVATTSAAGLYGLAATAPAPHIATAVRLEVTALEDLGNVSARVRLNPGEHVQVLGFVVRGTQAKELLLRAVGPTLRSFGIADPVRHPRLRIFTATGEELNVVRPAVVLPPSHWASVFRRAGAFPLVEEELLFQAFDVVSLLPGAYTLHLSDGSREGGEILGEIYELEPELTVL